MARPRKSAADMRLRWDALYVTAAERAAIAGAARAAGQSVSRYLIGAHADMPRPRGQDNLHRTRALIAAEQQLSDLSDRIAAAAAPLDAVLLQAELRAIERAFRQVALPGSPVLDATEAPFSC